MKLTDKLLTNSALSNFKLTTDPLLRKEGIFYRGTKLNIYKMLVRFEDFKTNNKGQFIKKMPFVLDSANKISDLLKKLPDAYKKRNFSKLRNLFCSYQTSKHLRVKTLRSFMRNRYFPITFVRVLSKITNEPEFNNIIENSYLTDFSKFNKIKLFSDIRELPDFIFYLFGIILGDGTMNKERVKIVDGDERQNELAFSEKFLDAIRGKIEEMFKTHVPEVTKIPNKNCYELRFNNKWLCYFFNALFGLEFGKKINPKIKRKLILNLHQRNLILRGLFDTDGSVDGHRVTLATRYRFLLNEVIRTFREQDINNISIRKILKDRLNPVFLLTVHSESILKYAKAIGFSHPRKSLELKKYVLSHSREKVLKTCKETKLNSIGNFIKPIVNQKLAVTPDFFKLSNQKRHALIKLFNRRFNCDFQKLLRNNNCINSRPITKRYAMIFKYEPKRKAVSVETANKLHTNWLRVWA